MKEKNTEISARIEEVIFILHTNPNKFANALGIVEPKLSMT